MKKLNFIAMITMTVFILSSCEKESIQPAEQKAAPVESGNFFNEKNSKAITWNEFPENLRNAEAHTAFAENTGKIAASYITVVGPWGGGGGGAYYIYPAGGSDKIYAIGIRAGAYVDALTVWYVRPNGTLYSYGVGGTGGAFYLQLITSTERITAIGGRSGAYLDRLTIYTNYKTFSYGGNGGNPFYASALGYQILGFFGGAGKYVDRLGGYIYSL
jgi:hypothetical protein